MATDINLILSLFAFCVMLGVIGIWKKIPLLMLIGGALIAFIAVLPMDLTNGTRIETLDTTTDIIVPTYEDEPVNLDIYPKIFFGILGSMFMIAGALIWYQEQ